MRALLASGHSRAPVCLEGDLDRSVGLVHLRDLLNTPPSATAGEVAVPATYLPESLPVLDAMRRMQQQRQQMVLVIDQHGGVEGIVTMEDLVEEVVGEIYDESDRDVVAAVQLPDGSRMLPGSFPVHDLIDLGVEVPPGEYATVAGLILEHLGHLPRGGEAVELPGWRFVVVEVDRRAILRVRLEHLR
jgi:putative hemolysin